MTHSFSAVESGQEERPALNDRAFPADLPRRMFVVPWTT